VNKYTLLFWELVNLVELTYKDSRDARKLVIYVPAWQALWYRLTATLQ